MTTTYEIPLAATPQSFSITLGPNVYTMRLVFRDALISGMQAAGWVLDILDGNDKPLVAGIPLTCGLDLLAQYEYLNFGVQLYVQTDGSPDTPPDFASLGTASHLYLVTVP